MIYFVCYSKVINWKSNLKFPQERRLSEEAKDLISKLLCGADQRLGKGGVHEIKVISYFAPQYTLDYWKKNNRTKTLERIVKEVPWCQCLQLKVCRKNECISAKHFFQHYIIARTDQLHDFLLNWKEVLKISVSPLV